MHIKKGDNVILLTGDDKGKKGKVEKVFTKNNTAVVEGLNMKKRHQRPRKEGAKGQVIEVAMPIQVSNLRKAEATSKRKK